MPTSEEIYKQANQLLKDKKYKAAIPIFKKLWENPPSNLSIFYGKNYAFCLRKNGQYEEALMICETIMSRYPEWKDTIIDDYYWNIYYTKIKKKWDENQKEYIYNKEDVLLKYGTEIKIQYQSQLDKKYSPYYKAIFSVVEYYNGQREYEKVIEWLKPLDPNSLQTNSTFINEYGIPINNEPERKKYFKLYSIALFYMNDYEKFKGIALIGLKEYPDLVETLAFHTAIILHSKGENLFNLLLSKIGFSNDEIRDNYLMSLMSGQIQYLKHWENNFNGLNDYEASWELKSIGNAIKKILIEIDFKTQTWTTNRIETEIISSSKIADFVYCPVSFAIQQSIPTEDDHDINIELVWTEKKLLLDRLNIFKATQNIEKAFADFLEIGIDPTVNALIKNIFSSTLLLENKSGKTTKVFYNTSTDNCGAPDYVFKDSNQTVYVVEEKFSKYQLNKEQVQTEFPNHRIEILNHILELNELDSKYGILIYWYWDFVKQNNQEQPHQENSKAHYKIKGFSIFKITPDQNDKETLAKVLQNVKEFKQDKISLFAVDELNSNKCVNCGVCKYCYHKTGRLDELTLPYERRTLQEFLPGNESSDDLPL